MPMRPESSTRIVLTKPCPSSPSSWSAGMRQLSKRTSLVSLARIPSLSSFLPGVMPGVPFSTMKAEMPLGPAARSVTAITTMMSPTRPCVVNVFEPFSTQQVPARAAAVRIPAASLPEVDSVRPQAPIFSPRASGARYCCFCASVPTSEMCEEQRPLCAATDNATLGSTRASSSMQMQ